MGGLPEALGSTMTSHAKMDPLTFDLRDSCSVLCVPHTDVCVNGTRHHQLGVRRPVNGRAAGSVEQHGKLLLQALEQREGWRVLAVNSVTGYHASLQ